MTALGRWGPIKEMEDLQGRLGAGMGLPARATAGKEALAVADWTPLVDITEDEKEFLLKVELPGVKREDVKVSVTDGVLNLAGERRFEKETRQENYHRIERAYGGFSRAFSSPAIVDEEKTRADYKDGILKIALPKKEQVKPKQIQIAELK